MLNRSWSLFAALGLLMSAQRLSAAPLMVDDFETPTPAEALLIGINHDNAKPYQQLGSPVTIGDQRDMMVQVLGTPKANSAQVLIGYDGDLFEKGIFQVTTASDPGAVVTLQYDGEDLNVEELTNAHGLLEHVLGGMTIDFLTVDAPGGGSLGVEIHLYSQGVAASYSGGVAESGSPISLYADYAEFDVAGGFDFAAVDSFEIVFNSAGQVDVDFVVDQIWTVVPEPSTLALGLLTLPGLVMLRRPRR